jgi:hypothetical protein
MNDFSINKIRCATNAQSTRTAMFVKTNAHKIIMPTRRAAHAQDAPMNVRVVRDQVLTSV